LKSKLLSALKKTFYRMADTLKFKSIQFIITFSFTTIMILSMLFISLSLYGRFNASAEQSALTSTRQIINQVNSNFDYFLISMMDISNSLKDMISEKESISDDRLIEEMNIILASRKDIVTLAVFSKEGELITGVPERNVKRNARIEDQEWFTSPLKSPANLFFSSPHVQNIYEGQYNWVMSLSREITYLENGEKKQGVLLVDMNFSALDKLCQKVKLGSRGYIYIIDSEGSIVYHPQQELINANLKTENIRDVQEHVFGTFYDTLDGERRLITVQTINYCRWRIVGIAYIDDIVSTRDEIETFVIWIMIISIIFAFLTSAFISSKISEPIKKLEKSMKLVEQGKFDIFINVSGEAEVAQLSKAFNIMVSRIRNLMDQIVKEQEAKRISELNALQAQINPHFLYNTLDSIVWMAERGKSSEVITMVTALAKLFRISISRGRNVITVREELEHARNYLIIQSIRYRNKFSFEIEAQEETLKLQTIKLILQPIIENAIYHGIEYMVDQGIIQISVRREQDRLLFVVKDNGLGIKPEILKSILAQNPKSSGVGVKNVHERIQLFYGSAYGLNIESRVEEGTTVTIVLPVIHQEGVGGARDEQVKKIG
jgi:two-component system sensor histidine kinase YesM